MPERSKTDHVFGVFRNEGMLIVRPAGRLTIRFDDEKAALRLAGALSPGSGERLQPSL
ncbi:hypothetical protein [Syntrophus aciditrophicus]|uniref:Hypothetical cytosolic protein n=1 Tax=Syntrophus aciditrophicus (strain SB) TaxID=56780 RepID=Q2LTC6_SYNAS|nr:hypothetical protein [Syntrophus aciditrophicus]ABC77339.1 hypothetical cytosolic protein [Syntrophus aciditrophicus SB]